MRDIIKLIIAIAVSELAGVIGSFFTISAISTPSTGSGQAWYATLVKPALNPPSWVFGPVWAALYALMGISLFLIWKRHSNILENVGMLRVWKIGIMAFFVQLFLNAIWSIIFFGLRSPGWALIEIIFLWLAIFATITSFYKISPPSSSIWTTEGHGRLAAYLLLPYILWVSFAIYLNYTIWILN